MKRISLLNFSLTSKLITSLCAGALLTIATWFYLNSYYTLEIEDSLFEKEVVIKNKIFEVKPAKNKSFIFINTGNDLKLIDKPDDLGSAAVTDRFKLYQLLKFINISKYKPDFTLLNLEFIYPYQNTTDSIRLTHDLNCKTIDFPDKSIDDSLQNQISQSKRLMLCADYKDDKIQKPIYNCVYGISYFETYGKSVNKIRLSYPEITSYAMPCLLDQKLDRAIYSPGKFLTLCNGKLSFNYLWPDYYYTDEGIKAEKQNLYYPTINGALEDFKSEKTLNKLFDGKILIIGNLNIDMDSPAGKITGTVILIDTYLSLLNGKQFVPVLWILFLFLVFSLLSFISIFSALPELKFKLHFLFSEQLTEFLQKFISYIAFLFVLSMISVFIFDISISLIIPAFIFSGIAYLKKIN